VKRADMQRGSRQKKTDIDSSVQTKLHIEMTLKWSEKEVLSVMTFVRDEIERMLNKDILLKG